MPRRVTKRKKQNKLAENRAATQQSVPMLQHDVPETSFATGDFENFRFSLPPAAGFAGDFEKIFLSFGAPEGLGFFRAGLLERSAFEPALNFLLPLSGLDFAGLLKPSYFPMMHMLSAFTRIPSCLRCQYLLDFGLAFPEAVAGLLPRILLPLIVRYCINVQWHNAALSAENTSWYEGVLALLQ